jgi:hypothetical protein
VPGGPLSRVGTARGGAPLFALGHSLRVNSLIGRSDHLYRRRHRGRVRPRSHRASLRLPPIVGYLLAGTLIGPHTPGFLAETAIARQIADIGIILIMFGVGLKFRANGLLVFRLCEAIAERSPGARFCLPRPH